MDTQNYNPSLFEAIDACRAGSDDLSLPHMSELADQLREDEKLHDVFERSQRLDRAIGRAFSDVSVPVGLEERLVAAVVSQESPSPPTGDAESENKRVQLSSRAAGKQGRLRGRRLAMGTGIAACLAVMVTLAAIVILDPWKSDPITKGDVFKHTRGWIEETVRQEWNKDVSAAPVRQYPMARSLKRSLQIQQWQRIETEFGKAVVYDLAPAGEPWAMLFVVQTSDEEFDVGKVLPQFPDMTTRGISVGFCYRDGKLYVFVLEGLDEQRYKSFFKELNPVA